MTNGPPDLPRALGQAMALGVVAAIGGFGAIALDLWSDLTARFEPRIVSRAGADGRPELVVQRDRSGRYVVPGNVRVRRRAVTLGERAYPADGSGTRSGDLVQCSPAMRRGQGARPGCPAQTRAFTQNLHGRTPQPPSVQEK